MDQEKIGKFIQDARRKKNLTQYDLANMLDVTDKAVSKWERGLNLPDASIMQELCYTLGISLNELFAGEHLKEKEINFKDGINLIYGQNEAGKSTLIKFIFI